MLRLLCITAHPDDEAGGFGGTLLHYASRGVETHVICLTPGQAGSHRGPAQSSAELAALRREEFAASCKILKVSQGEVLGYEDAALYRADFFAVVGDLAQRVRKIRPHVMITLGTEGAVTAHPDHSMAALFATMAFHWAGRKSLFPEQLANGLEAHRTQKLYYGTAEFTIKEREPVSLAPITVTLDISPYLASKLAAFRAHTTQAPLFPIFERNVMRLGGKERFHLAAAVTPRLAQPEADLFEGVTE